MCRVSVTFAIFACGDEGLFILLFPVEFQWFSEVVHPYSHWFGRPIRNVSNIMLLAKQV